LEVFMCRKLIALLLVWSVPSAAVAGPLKDAAEKAGREMALARQAGEGMSRARLWTGVALIAGGGVLTALGGFEIGDDETGPDDEEDLDTSDDGEDSDTMNKVLLGGGIAAATLGGVILLTGRNSGPRVSVGRNGVVVRQTVRF
jgi:hypothetical protein